jgi:hypothetical protein
MPSALWWSCGRGQFLKNEVPEDVADAQGKEEEEEDTYLLTYLLTYAGR